MLVERPQTKPKTKRRFIRTTFVILVVAWLSFLSIAVVMVDDGFKKRLNQLEQEVQSLKAANQYLMKNQK